MLIKILNVKPVLHFRDKHYLMHYQCIIFFVYFWIWHASILIWSISSFDGNLLQYSWLVISLFAFNFCSLPLCYLIVEYCILIEPSIYHTIMLKLYQVDTYHTLFSPQDPTEIPHCIHSPCLLDCDSFSDFIFDDFDSFEDYKSDFC